MRYGNPDTMRASGNWQDREMARIDAHRDPCT
jgi:hypothetical protein